MFRGFEVSSASEYEEVLLKFDSHLSDKYRGTSPRSLQPGTKVNIALHTWHTLYIQTTNV